MRDWPVVVLANNELATSGGAVRIPRVLAPKSLELVVTTPVGGTLSNRPRSISAPFLVVLANAEPPATTGGPKGVGDGLMPPGGMTGGVRVGLILP